MKVSWTTKARRTYFEVIEHLEKEERQKGFCHQAEYPVLPGKAKKKGTSTNCFLGQPAGSWKAALLGNPSPQNKIPASRYAQGLHGLAEIP
ncbi:MAG: hypothetical protein KAR19_11245 [Bacteroidales bacterium]|nr:hypothetical protein [Bacteroidales bacterium]